MAQKLTRQEFDEKVAVMRENNERLKILHEIKIERAKYCNKEAKKQAKTSTLFVIASIAAVVVYTCAALVIQAYTGAEVSSTLTTHWYTFWTIEIAALTGIKVTKVIKENNSDSTNDDENNEIVG